LNILAIDFPPISHLIEWPAFALKDTPFAINKVVVLIWLSALVVFLLFFAASRRQQLVPTGVQNFTESIVDFVRNDIIMQTMGTEGLKWTPYLTTLFVFVFMCNIWEIIPIAQMPVNARIAVPLFLTGLTWIFFIVVGIMKQGPWGYFKNMMFPPGVPWPLYILVTPIELVSTILVRPVSLSLRLFANMLVGHLLLVTFAVLTATLVKPENFTVGAIGPFALLVALMGFEVLVSLLQAFIFTILTAVYIGGAMHPEH
jgi:F-type H+-transporting ATPase subunit a